MANVKFKSDKPVSRFTIAEGDNNSGLAAYCLVDSKLAIVKQSQSAGDPDILGAVENGEFRALSGQQSVLVGWQWRPVPIYMDYIPYYWSPY